MAQPVFYTYSGAFIPGTLARAEAEATEFTSVQVGFDKLAIQGIDSGTANAYVVTTSGGQDGAYSDGMVVEFKAANSNTGGSTIAVDSGTAVGLTQPNGQSLVAGAIIANNWYTCRYNSTYSAWTVIAPSSTVITSNTISAAAPTHLVGLVAAGGVSTACAPIDVTFALDQTISPTMTGAWKFSGAVQFASTVTFATGFTLTGANNAYAITLDGSATLGESYGVEINAGTNASDIAFLVNNQSGGTAFFEILGTGGVTVGSPTGGSQGLGTINATGLFVNGAAVKTTSISSANPSATIGLAAVDGTALTFMTSDSAPALSQAIVPTMTGAWTFTPSSAVTAVTINARVNAAGLSLVGGTNTVNTYLLSLATGQGSGFSSGISIQAGTSSADAALYIANAAATLAYFAVFGDGETYVYQPTTYAAVGPSGTYQVGMMEANLNSQISGSYALVMTDRGKLVETAGHTLTIPANASVAFPVGTTIVVFNGSSASSTTIAITSDTLLFIPSNSTGSRTLAPLSVATLYKLAATEWLIWGFGIT
jgi:hypothetical protein